MLQIKSKDSGHYCFKVSRKYRIFEGNCIEGVAKLLNFDIQSRDAHPPRPKDVYCFATPEFCEILRNLQNFSKKYRKYFVSLKIVLTFVVSKAKA